VKSALGLWLALASGVPLSARAEGYYSGTKGARAMGRAGAFSVKADDLSAVSLNPAGLCRIEGTLLHVGNRWSYNAHTFTRQPTLDFGNLEAGVPPYVEFAPSKNQRPWQLLDPLLGVASTLGLEGWAFALSVFAPPGVAREQFSATGGQRYLMLDREAILLDTAASAAYRFGDELGVGTSLIWRQVPRLEYQLVIDASQFAGEANPVSSELDMRARTTGSDGFVPGAAFGAWYRPTPFLEFGVSTLWWFDDIHTDSRLSIQPISAEIDDEVVLRRDGEPADDVELSLALPHSARFGVRYRHFEGSRELFDLEIDLEYEAWSRVERFDLDGQGLVATLLAQRIDIGRIQIEKQWKNTWSLHVGGDVEVVPGLLALRGGLLHESAVADPRYAHVDFVSGRQWGGAVGASLFLSGFELAFAYDYRHQPSVTVTEGQARVYQVVPSSACQAPYTDADLCNAAYLGQSSPAVNGGTYFAHSHVAALDVLYRF
jgi:long-subunit fatty acid transport protein